MKIINNYGNNDIAKVYLAKLEDGNLIEFVHSVQPPLPKEKKLVFIISTLKGCPVACPICDAGGFYKGKLNLKQLWAQIDFLMKENFHSPVINCEKLKIQFARMGEPTFNPAVLKLLQELPKKITIPGLIPSISTTAPSCSSLFMEKLVDIKNTHYKNGNFQLQFSIHSTDDKTRDEIIPINKWNLEQIARYGNLFLKPNDRKITLNFALADTYPLDAKILKNIFDPEMFMLKITPLNPTIGVIKNNLNSYINNGVVEDKNYTIKALHEAGFDVIISVGELEENQIGSNCGQYVTSFLKDKEKYQDQNTYEYIKKAEL